MTSFFMALKAAGPAAIAGTSAARLTAKRDSAYANFSDGDIRDHAARMVEIVAAEDDPEGEWEAGKKKLREIAGTPQGLPVNVTNEIIETTEERLQAMRLL